MPDEEVQREIWDKNYANNPDFFGVDASEIAVNAIGIFRDYGLRKVLELGCGQGRDTWHLANAGFQVCALDYSETGICQMQERGKEMGVECRLVVHDALRPLPFPDGHFDAVFSHMFFTMQFSMDDLHYIMKECLRVLRPGGINIYSVRNHKDRHYGKFTPRGEDTWENPLGFVVHFLSEDNVRELADGYEILSIKEFIDGSPPFDKTLYEVVMQKP